MNDKETYGVVVEAKTNLFKKSLQELSGIIRKFGKVAEEETTVTPKFEISPDINLKELYKWREDLQKEIDKTQENMTYLKGSPTQKFFQEDLDRYKDGLEAVNYRINELEGTQNDYNSELDETNEELDEIDNASKRTSNALKSMLDSGISKIKRFTYYLLGARSVFSLFMKYQSIYYQYNEKMQYQSELSQNAIALSLAPAFEFLGNMVAYASIGFAKFIELLTGVNVLSKVTTKGIRDYNKSLKETQTLVSGIDEVTNLNLPTNTGLASQYKALDDFQKKVAEVTKWFDENTWISDIAKGIRSVYDFVNEHWDIFKYIFGAVAITTGIKFLMSATGISTTLGTLASVGGIASLGTGLGGVASLLSFIAGIGIITLTIALYYKTEYDKLKEEKGKAKDLKKNIDLIGKSLKQDISSLKTLNKNSDSYNNKLIDINNKWDAIVRGIQLGDEEVLNNIEDVEKLGKELSNITNDDYYVKSFDISKAIGLDVAERNNKTFWQELAGKLSGADKVWDKQREKLINDWNDLQNQARKSFKNVSDIIDNTFKEKVFKISLKYNIDKNSVINLANKVVGLSSMLGVPSSTINNLKNNILKNFGYAKGLDYVPYDNYPALLHKGEAVVPAKYNPTIHSEGNEYTNSLLETVVMKLDDLSRRPNVLNIDGQQFANATYELYEEARNNQNYVEGVVR